MKHIKSLVLALVASSISVSAQSCLSNCNIQQGDPINSFVYIQKDMTPEWFNIWIKFNSFGNRFSAVGYPEQPVYWRVDITKMNLNGTMTTEFKSGWLEAPGFFTQPSFTVETHFQRCGYFSNVQVTGRVYTTLPPVGTQIGIGNAWLN